jgi:naphtho-gamma-pyrone polyketide synthase
VASLDSCDHDFNGVAEIVLDRENLEVAANVRFKKSVCSGKYLASPHPIDNFGRPAIFSMNANDTADLDKKVFVNHGWTSLHFYKPVSLDGEYYSYMNMSGPEAGCLHGGEMVVSEGTEIVAAFNVIKPQGVPRRLMNYTVRLRDNTSQGPLTAVTRQLIEAPSVNTGPSVVV